MAKNLKKTKVTRDFLTDIDMFLMPEKSVRNGICHAIHQYPKVSSKYMKSMMKIKNRRILSIWM